MCDPCCRYTKADCCGNGCANCVLNQNTRPPPRSCQWHKTNVLEEYRKYKLIERIQLKSYIFQLLFRLADKEQLTEHTLDCPPGYHIMMRAPDPDATDNSEIDYIVRPYTPFWSDSCSFEFKILINTKPQGKMTKYFEQLNIGDEAEFRGPIGSYKHIPCSQDKKLLIYTQGVAIAPAIPIIEQVLSNENDFTKIYHTMCFEDLDGIIFRSEIISYNRFWNYSAKIYLAWQHCEQCGYGPCTCGEFEKKLRHSEKIYSRRLTKEDVHDEMTAIGCEGIEAIICGAKSFQDFIIDALACCKVKEECIHVL